MSIVWWCVVVGVGFLQLGEAAICSEDTAGQIIQGPRDMTVFENQIATFSCVIEIINDDHTFTHWDMNGTLNIKYYYTSNATFTLSLLRNETREFTQYSYLLPAAVVFNNTLIQCRHFSIDAQNWTYICSDNATLTIQGPPEAVTDFRVAESVSEVVVLWQAPFTLDVTDVEYDITYSLLISNITDENQPTPVTCDLCHNLTLTHFVFYPPHPLPGHSFNFTVTPQNGAGTGPPSDTLTATLTNSSHDNEISSSQATLSPTSTVSEDSTQKSATTATESIGVSPTGYIPSETPHNPLITAPVQSPTAPVPTASKDLSTAIISGITSAIFLLLLLVIVTLGILIWCHHKTIKLQQNTETILMQRNDVYGDNEKIEMQNNPVYGVNGRIEMQHNQAYALIGPIQTSRNISYDTVQLS